MESSSVYCSEDITTQEWIGKLFTIVDKSLKDVFYRSCMWMKIIWTNTCYKERPIWGQSKGGFFSPTKLQLLWEVYEEDKRMKGQSFQNVWWLDNPSQNNIHTRFEALSQSQGQETEKMLKPSRRLGIVAFCTGFRA